MSVLAALSSVAMLSAVGGNIDAAALHQESERLQAAADAAALHALREIAVRNAGDGDAGVEAARLLDANFGAPLVAGQVEDHFLEQQRVETTVLSRDPARLTVTATRLVELPFGVLGSKHVAVTRTAQATETERTPLSLLLLDPSASAVWSLSGTSKVVADGAAVVNSSSPSALSGRGNAEVVADLTRVVGPASAARSWTPAPVFDSQPVADPFKAKVRWPSDAACAHRDLTVKKAKAILKPGVYCGGLRLETHAEVVLEPGVYVLQDGPLTVSAHASLSGPEGVTVVMTGDAAVMDISSGAQVTLRAPKTGPWDDIAVAVKPQSSELTSTLIGGGELVLDGVLYFPSQKLKVTGGGSAEADSGGRVLVANRLETSGNGEIRLRGSAEMASIPTGARLER